MDNKKMKRSYTDSIIGGVAGGLGNYFEIDPVIFRILFLAFTFIGGGGILVYILLWIFLKKEVPNEAAADKVAEETELIDENGNVIASERKKSGSIIGGGLLIMLGLGLLFDDFFNWFNWEVMLPLALVCLGVAIIFMNYKPKDQ